MAAIPKITFQFLTCHCQFVQEDQDRFVAGSQPGPELEHPCHQVLRPCVEKSTQAEGICGLEHQRLSHSQFP